MPPMPAAAPDMPMDDTAPAPGADDMGDQSGQVLCTVLKNPDGGYTLMAGDEEDGGASPPEAGGEMGGDMAPAKPEGQTFSEPGALLKAVLDILTKDQESGSGPAQGHFEAGYSGDSAPTPKKAPPKY